MDIISILFSTVHEILTEAIMQEKKIKEIQIGKPNYTIYRWFREPKNFIGKPISSKQIQECDKLQNPLAGINSFSIYKENKHTKKKLMDTFPFIKDSEKIT